MIKKSFFLSFGLILLYSCSGEQKEPTNALMKEALTPNGKKIYNRYCVVCHGDEGNAKVGGAFDLSISTLSFEDKVNIVTNGSENKHMRAFNDDLNEAEIKAVVKHVETLKK